jgi:hypothetical protein
MECVPFELRIKKVLVSYTWKPDILDTAFVFFLMLYMNNVRIVRKLALDKSLFLALPVQFVIQ